MKDNFQARLDSMKQNWDKSQGDYDAMFGGSDIPASDYNLQLVSMNIKESGSSGNLMVVRQFTILEGEYEGKNVFDNMQLETPRGFTFVRRFIEQMGYEAPENPGELPDTLEAILGDEPVLIGKVTHSDDFTNIRIVKLIETTDEDGDEGGNEDGESEGEAEDGESESGTGDDADELINNMLAFCATWGIDVTDESDYDTIRQAIEELNYPVADIDENESQMLIDIGLEANIEQPKPVKKTPAKKTPAKKAPAKKAPAKKSVKKKVVRKKR